MIQNQQKKDVANKVLKNNEYNNRFWKIIKIIKW